MFRVIGRRNDHRPIRKGKPPADFELILGKLAIATPADQPPALVIPSFPAPPLPPRGNPVWRVDAHEWRQKALSAAVMRITPSSSLSISADADPANAPPTAARMKLSIPIGRPTRSSVERPGSSPMRL